MRFTDQAGTQEHTEANPLESTFMLADTTDTVGGFFERPQLIFSEEWSPNAPFFYTLDPWTEYFSNTKVVERLSNFHLLRCKLKVKVVLNGTPFYFGRLMMSYNPLSKLDAYTFYRNGTQQDFIEASQRPNIVLDPSVDEIGEMTLPYIYPKSALNIETGEWAQMGSLTLADLTTLLNANDADDALTVSVFAWAEDVQYSQPTSAVIVPNQGEYEDNAPSGIVSKPATTVARLSTALANIPIIAPYAKATQLAASAIAKIASLFGMSRPRNVAPAYYYIPGMFRRFTQTNIQDETDVLALDCKKEVPIDPRVVGCDGADPMEMLSIAKHESYLTSFTWTDDSAVGTLLYNFAVNPMMYTNNGTTDLHLTPMAWLSVPFRYWRGSVSYRFEIVASQFHRGRLRLVYDPVFQVTGEYNVNYTEILDIRDGCDFTIDVGWAQGVPYLLVPPLDFTGDYHQVGQIPGSPTGANGILSVFVLNSLTTPGEVSNDVKINVYVSANDDFELQEPTGGALAGIMARNNGVNPTPPSSGVPPTPVPQSFGTFLSYIQPGGDRQAPETYGDRATLIGADATSIAFPGQASLTIQPLAPSATDYDATFTLLTSEWPPGTTPGFVTLLPDFGLQQVVQFSSADPNRNDLNVANVTVTIPAGATNYTMVFGDGTPLASLAITDLLAGFETASFETRAQDWNFSQLSGLVEYGTAYAPHISISPGAAALIAPNITGNLQRLMYSSEGATPSFAVTVDGQTQAPVNDSETTIPRQNAGSLGGFTVTATVQIENLSTVPLKIYALGMLPIPNQSDIVEDDTAIVAGDSSEKPRLCDVFFGESVVSIRQIMKRYTTTAYMTVEDDVVSTQAFPLMPKGYAVPQLATPAMSLWDWYIPAFVGWKGSTRVKVIPSMPRREGVAITRVPGGASSFSRTTQSTTQTNVLNWSGATFGVNDAIAEAEIPWYSPLRFLPARAASTNEFFEPVMAYQVEIYPGNATTSLEFSRILSAIGEDFSTYMFLCTPVITPSP